VKPSLMRRRTRDRAQSSSPCDCPFTTATELVLYLPALCLWFCLIASLRACFTVWCVRVRVCVCVCVCGWQLGSAL
jgi:hypothetical protein